MKGRRVDFSQAEIVNGALPGVLRRVNGLFGAAQTVPGLDEEGRGWISDIEGALAERALAKALNVYWDSSLRRYRNAEEADVGPYHVRWTEHEGGHLVVRPHDKPDAPYVLVVGVAPHYRVVGWMLGRDAKEYKDDPGGRGKPCGWVPQSALHDLSFP